ncbi:MAG: hypothetical protein ACRDKE_02900 [Solirubrobacterales bacterium]
MLMTPERRVRLAALVSLLPILFGIGFVFYAFMFEAVNKTVIFGESQTTVEETIVEAGGDAGAVFAFAPLVLGAFVAILLHLARKDNDTAPIYMAWAFSGFLAIVSLVGGSNLGVYFVAPAVLMLLATGATHFVVGSSR